MTPYSILKPGQAKLERTYYDRATNERPSGVDYLRNTSRYSSLYNEDQNKNVKNGDYTVPKRDANLLIDYDLRHNKDLFQYT